LVGMVVQFHGHPGELTI